MNDLAMADDGAQPLFTWYAVAYWARDLVKQIRAAGVTVTHVVAIPRGGLVLGTMMSYAFAVPLHICNEPEPWMPPTTLVCDDNTITGGSLAPFARQGMPCAVFVKHPQAPAVSPFFFGFEDDDMWLFPWEIEGAREPFDLRIIVDNE